jgi:uncharacterized protein YdeI (YjbR/CyaY-like superfamily)
MDITETFHAPDRDLWRAWLEENHASAREIWLVKDKTTVNVLYQEAVEEALCFGWIDGIAKTIDPDHTAQRFTPRKPKSNWTELNKERLRRLIAAGKMTEAGLRYAPDLSLEAFVIAEDILAALQADPQVWANFSAFPGLYQRVRVDYLEDARKKPAEFAARLERLLHMTAQNKQFGGAEARGM